MSIVSFCTKQSNCSSSKPPKHCLDESVLEIISIKTSSQMDVAPACNKCAVGLPLVDQSNIFLKNIYLIFSSVFLVNPLISHPIQIWCQTLPLLINSPSYFLFSILGIRKGTRVYQTNLMLLRCNSCLSSQQSSCCRNALFNIQGQVMKRGSI